MPSLRIDPREFAVGWRIVILALLGVATSAAVLPLYGFGALAGPLEEAFAWERRDLLVTVSFLSFGAVFSSQLAGWMNHLYGLKRVTLASLALLPLVFVAMSRIDLLGGSIWILYACFFVVTFAGMGTLQITWTQLINQWFDKNRGLALAMILSGSGMAGIFLPPAITMVVEIWDWRAGFLLLAGLPLLITLPLTLVWLASPGQTAQTPDAPAAITPDEPAGIEFAQGIRDWRYWTINLSMAMVASAIIIMVVNQIPLLREKGFSAVDAAGMFSAFGVSLVAGRVGVGYLVDRFWAPGIAFVALFLPAIGCLLLALINTDVPSLILAIMLVGIGAGAEYDIAAFLIARYFGLRDYSRLFGVQCGVVSAGICIAPALAAFMYDAAAGYATVLVLNMVLFSAGSALLLLLGPYPEFTRDDGGAAAIAQHVRW